MNLSRKAVLTSVILALVAQPAMAVNQPRGHIFNIDGEECTFTQTTTPESYLHSASSNMGHLVFDDPMCMSAQGVAEGVNAMMITAVRLKSEQFQLVGYLRSKGFGFVHRKGLI